MESINQHLHTDTSSNHSNPNNIRIKRIVANIQHMSKMEAEELFKLINTWGCPFTNNNHGVFLNLNWINEDMLINIERFIDYCNISREQLEQVETIQYEWNKRIDNIQNAAISANEDASFTSKNKKLKSGSNIIDDNSEDIRKVRNTGITRFYLLKKRFQRLANSASDWDDFLEPETYPQCEND